MARNFLLSALIVLFAALPAQAAGPPETAGRVEFVIGDARFIDAWEQVRRPMQGDRLRASDTIVTGADGEVHLDMEDGGYLAVRANTRLKVEEYRAQGDKDDHVLLKLIKGTFRSFTGWIPAVAPKGYEIRTITAVLGVRGTDHEPMFIPEGSDIGEPGTYDKVNEGATFIEHASGRIEIPANKAGFAPLAPDGVARLLERIPDFFLPSPNENLLAGRHKMVQERLQERLDARRRLNKPRVPQEEQPAEMQEAPTKGTPEIQDAPASSFSPGIPAVPGIPLPAASAVAPSVPAVTPPATVPAIPAASPAVAAPKASVAVPAAAAPKASVAVPAVAVPKVPATVPAVAAPNAPATSPTVVAPGAADKSSPTVAAPAKEKPAAVVPKATERPRSASGRPRGVPEDKPAAEPPPPKVVPPDANDREKAYNERRKKQQENHQDQYERDRDLERERDLDHERDADRAAGKRNKEQR